MSGSGGKNLSDALAFVLGELGASVLDDPRRLVAALSDVADQRSREMRVLRLHCNDQLLGFYAPAVTGGAEAIRSAAGRAERYLADDCVVDTASAHEVAWQLARGLASWCGISLPEEQGQEKAAKKEKAKAKKPEPEPEAKKPEAKKPEAKAGAATATRQSRQPTTTTSSATTNQASRTAPAKAGNSSHGGIVLLVLACLLGFVLFRMFGWRIGLETEAYVNKSVQTWLSNGYLSSDYTYRHDVYGNLTSTKGTFQTEDGDTFDVTESYEGYDDYGYPATYTHSYTVTEPGGKVSSRAETTEEFEYRYDPSGRLHSKVVTTTQRYQHSGGEWDEPQTSKELVIYRYANDLPFGLASLWTAKKDSSIDTVTEMEFDGHDKLVRYVSDTTGADGDDSHYESTCTYRYSGDQPKSSVTESKYTSGSYSSSSRSESTYDGEGNITHQTDTDDGEVTAEYEFEYDSDGNLTSRTNLTDGTRTEWQHTRVPRGSIAVRTGIR